MKKSKTSSPAGRLILALAAALGPCGAAPIINENFEFLAPGARPDDVLVNGVPQTTGLRPMTNVMVDGFVLAQVVSGAENTAGDGNGLQLIDDDATPNPADSTTGYEVDVVPGVGINPVSNLHVSFDIAWTDYTSFNGEIDGQDAFRMGLGAFGGSDSLVLGSSTRRFCTVEFENDGEIDGFGGSSQLTSGSAVSVELFANDSDTESISYSPPGGGSAMLAPNEVALYVGGTLEGSTTLMDNTDSMSPVPLAGDYNIGRFGFASFSDGFGLSYVIDNLVVEEIVESSVLLIEDFESQTLGDSPEASRSTPGNPEFPGEPIPDTGPPELDPSNPPNFYFEEDFADERYVLVIEEPANTAGTGQAVEILDKKEDAGLSGEGIDPDAATGGFTGLEWNIVASEADEVSTLKLSLDISWRDEGLGSNERDRIFFGISGFDDVMSSKKRRDLPARVDGDGGFLLDNGSGGFFQLASGESYKLTVFLNDLDGESVTYEDPNGLTRLLASNTGDFYIDGTFVGSEEFRDRDMPESDPPLYPGDNNIGRVGFATATDDVGGALIVDNLFASEIAPATGEPILYNDDFESYADGGAVANRRTGASASPTIVAAVSGAGNVAGGGDGTGLRLQDILGTDGAEYEIEFSSVGDLHISFDAAWNDLMPAGLEENWRFKVRVGQTGKLLSSGSRSYFDVGLSYLGVVEFPETSVEMPPTLQLTSGKPVHFDVFVNDNDTNAVDYPVPGGGSASLPADSFAVYVDEVLLFTDVFDEVTDPITGTVGDATLGRFGIVASTDDVDLDYTFDNLVITEILEISTDPVPMGPVVIAVTQPDLVELTFDSVSGNDYRIWNSTEVDPESFSLLDTITAESSSTTYSRPGVELETREFFQVEDIGPSAQ